VALIIVATMLAVACDDKDGADETPTAAVTPPASPRTVAPTAPPGSSTPQRTPGPPATIELTAEPQQLVCDGNAASKVTARVFDAQGHPVADGAIITFGVVTLGTAEPINAPILGGMAETSVVALATGLAAGQGVPVVVSTSGDAGVVSASIRIDCL
jgi:hypothetical protein